MGSTSALILAGGRGKRMDLLCNVRPKPALSFAGRYRVIDFTLSNCVHSEISEIVMLTDYQRHQMSNYLREWNDLNGAKKQVAALEPSNGSYKGTADAVYQNLAFLKSINPSTILILAGDHVYKMDYRKMLAFHEERNADVTVGVASVPAEEVHRFGTINADKNDRITKFVEKTRTSPSTTASMGIYAFKPEVLYKRLEEDAANPGSKHDFGYDILPGMVNRDRVFAFSFEGYWEDIGTIEAYYKANMEILSGSPAFTLEHNWGIFTPLRNNTAPKKFQGGSIRNSIISPGCLIKGHVENSILSPGVWVDDEAVVKDSILMSDVFVGHHSMVDRCILDEGVNVGKFCYVGYGTSLVTDAWDVTVLGKGVSVPSHTAINRHCKLLPHVGPRDFDSSLIRSGSVVSSRSALERVKEKH